jgi:predicted O-linked N-acetylglucosamine transferase (SPINDLY family)
MPAADDLFREAATLHRQGRLDDSARLYSEVLDRDPAHVDALHDLAMLRLQQGRYGDAIPLCARALQIVPDSIAALYNGGLALHLAGRTHEALEYFDEVLRLVPDHLDTLLVRGKALYGLRRFGEALSDYERAVAIRPGVFAALAGRGDALFSLDRFDEAAGSYDEALTLDPKSVTVMVNRGMAALACNRVAEAIASFERALVLEPESVAALGNLGNALAREERYDEALACYDGSLALRQDQGDVLNNRGNVLSALRRYPEAIAAYDAAIALRPDDPGSHFNRGLAYFALGRHQDAIADLDRAIALNPGHAAALQARGHALTRLKRHAEAHESYAGALARGVETKYVMGDALHTRARFCDWAGLAAAIGRIEEGVMANRPVCVPFVFLSISDDPAMQLACAASYVRDNFPARQAPWTRTRRTNDRIRLAYLSANFHDHAVAYLISELFELHDRRRFEVTGISFGPDKPGIMRERIVRGMDRFVDVRGHSDADVAALLSDLQVDIAVDLMGFTEDDRPGILSHRPAPVQVNYLGYPGTIGAEYVDYIIADRFIIPEGEEVHYAERVVRLPDSYQANDRKRRIADRTPTRAEAGLPEDGFVFCCFNNNFKFTPRVFDVWMRLLERLEGSVLWLLQWSDSTAKNLRRETQARGVDPGRLVFAPMVPSDEHLARHRIADLFLDTLPYNAHTTASDALWAGLPVLTCAGRTFASRVAGSLLHAVDLPEMVTDSLEAYEARAVELATHPTMLRGIRERLQAGLPTARLFDSDRFRRHIEAAYVTMWDIHRRGEPPRAFAVEPIEP